MKKLLLAFLTLIGGIPALAQGQVLDPSFAQGGVFSDDFGSVFHLISLPSKNLITAGAITKGNDSYTLFGFKENGQYNPFFREGGMVNRNVLGFSTDLHVKAFSRGKSIYLPRSSTNTWAVVKIDTSGYKQTDFGFGGSGYIGDVGMQYLDAFTIDSQERLIVGSTESTIQGQGTQLIRFLPNGDFDSTFGINGFSIIITENYGAGTKGLYILQDGRILAGETGGGGAGTWMSVRFMPNGGTDYSYGDSGKVVIPLPGYFMRGTTLQPDKKVLQWGDNDSLMVIRLKENGAFDSTFGINGKMRYREAKMRTMLLMDDGRILLGGDTEDSMFAIYRLMPNGRLDTTFANGGILTIRLREDCKHEMNDLALQADGKLLAGGYVYNGVPYPAGGPTFTLARFMPNGRLDVGDITVSSKLAGILLYPNPTERALWVQKKTTSAGKVQLEVVDVMGSVVFIKTFAQISTEPFQLNIENLIPGTYQVVLRESTGKTWGETFVKR